MENPSGNITAAKQNKTTEKIENCDHKLLQIKKKTKDFLLAANPTHLAYGTTL
jgi:hypothetical protein